MSPLPFRVFGASAVLVASLVLIAFGGCKTADDSTATAPAAAPSAAAVPPAPEPPAGGRTVNGFYISSFEYWPFRWQEADGECPYPYPGGVRYGFGAGTAAAQACMRQAYANLWAILHDPPAALERLRDRGGPRAFFLWVNDYTEAKVDQAGEPVPECQPDPTLRGIWHYNPPQGLIKWVNEVYKDGTCRLRTAADLVRFAEATLVEMERAEAGP